MAPGSQASALASRPLRRTRCAKLTKEGNHHPSVSFSHDARCGAEEHRPSPPPPQTPVEDAQKESGLPEAQESIVLTSGFLSGPLQRRP